jgi:fermentation-respiration switch protein FrsA (DUF1100 family)
MNESMRREKVHFRSGDAHCVAWHYRGDNRACVVMAGGLAVTKEPGTDRFAERFNQAGFSVLAFDHRHLGESGGEPRQVARIGEQHADWQSAIDHARTLPEVDPAKIAIWGFSLAGGHVFPVAARNPALGAAIAQTPFVDGRAAARHAMPHTTPLAMLRLTARGILDAIGALFGRDPLLVPLAGEPGTVAMISSPDGLNADRALNPGGKYPDWQQAVAARSALTLGSYRPGRYASMVKCPLLVLVSQKDGAAPPEAAVRAGERAPRGEVVRRPGGHYEPFMDGHAEAVDIQLSFLRRHLLERPPTESAPMAPASAASH